VFHPFEQLGEEEVKKSLTEETDRVLEIRMANHY
jgi:hypothetical protein